MSATLLRVSTCLAILLCGASAAQGIPAVVTEILRSRFEGDGPASKANGQTDALAPGALRLFYERRSFRPAWHREAGGPDLAPALVEAVRAGSRHGMNPDDYRLGAIETALGAEGPPGAPPRPGDLADLELLLSDSFLAYGSHLLAGRVAPAALYEDWVATPRKLDVTAVLEKALAKGRVGEELEALAPRHPEYRNLQGALARYRGLAEGGGWEPVALGEKLARGGAGPRVAALRRRLAAEGYLPAAAPGDAERFDAALEQAVRSFQGRNGLAKDGAVGPATAAALNVSARARVQTIEVNLERCRWLPQDLGRRHLRVNVADFSLDVVEDGETVLSMPVVVGKPFNRTPVFSGTLSHIVLNPAWTVPQAIAEKEILPLARRDRVYLAKHRFRLFSGWGPEARAVDPEGVNWKAIRPKRLPFWFRQDPGPLNPLGTIKFVLANRFDVYLHDTPARGLFSRSRRDFSHGCIRVGRPIDLAADLMQGSPWTAGEILDAIARGEERAIALPRSVPVHILYCTAWADADGPVHFRNDIYGRDASVSEALARMPSRAASLHPGEAEHRQAATR